MPEIVTMGELICEIMRPEENMELFETGEFRGPFPSGAPGIFISTTARLGISSAIIAGVGKDDFGENILNRLKKDGVDVSRVIKSSKNSTGTAFVTYYSNGSRKFIFHVNGTAAVEPKAPADTYGLEDVKYFHIMGCSLMASLDFGREILKTMHMFQKQGAQISFDPNVRLEMMHDNTALQMIKEVFYNSDILMPGISELKMVTGKEQEEEAIKEAFQNKRLKILVLKEGKGGSRVYTREGQRVVTGVYKIQQIDATGAGDSYDAAFICGLLRGKTVQEAAKMGAAAGALNAAAFGPMEGNISEKSIEEMIKRGEIR